MAIVRTIVCDLCNASQAEPAPNAGWVGWSCFQGVKINEAENPNYCPTCTAKIADYIDAGGA